jgi:hypothetical protein
MEKPSKKCELVSWRRVQDLARQLANNIRTSGYKPDVIIAIARGGYVPARLLCDYLNIFDLTSIRIIHYDKGSHMSNHARLTSPLNTDVRNLKVLLVDDVSDTGDTLELAVKHIQAFSPATLKVAVLQHKQVSTFVPEFYAEKITTWRWLTYPWAVIEDLSSFIEQMDPYPKSSKEAARKLQKEYGIKPTLQILDEIFAILDNHDDTSRTPINEDTHMTDADPIIGNWYEHLDKGQIFLVVAYDEDEGIIEIQHFDGDVEELSMAGWQDTEIEPCEEPENWFGAVDITEDDDLGTEVTDTKHEDWTEPLKEINPD